MYVYQSSSTHNTSFAQFETRWRCGCYLIILITSINTVCTEMTFITLTIVDSFWLEGLLCYRCERETPLGIVCAVSLPHYQPFWLQNIYCIRFISQFFLLRIYNSSPIERTYTFYDFQNPILGFSFLRSLFKTVQYNICQPTNEISRHKGTQPFTQAM